MNMSKFIYFCLLVSSTTLFPWLLVEKVHADPIISTKVTFTTRTIPKDTAIVVQFSETYQLDAGVDQVIPLTALLVAPIQDEAGNIIVPAGYPVAVEIFTGNRTVKLSANQLLVNGKLVSISASSKTIPGYTVTAISGNDKGIALGGTMGTIFSGAVSVFGGSTNDTLNVGTGAAIIGNIIGLFSPTEVSIVTINKGTMYMMALDSDIYY